MTVPLSERPIARGLITATLALGLPLLACRADSVVVFNELYYNPAGTTEAGEWIELHNQMAVDTDLSGWRLDDGIGFTFPEGTVIPGGGYLIVAKDPGNPALPGGVTTLGPYSGFLSNSGERVDLLSSSDRLMDRIDWDDSGEWPVAADGAGVTLAKRNPGLSSGKSTHWVASAQTGGTPGAVNFALPGTEIPHPLIAADATWKFDDGGSTPPADWKTLGFNDTTWSEGQAIFGTASGTPVLTVTQDLVERFRAADIPGATQGQALSSWTDLATGDGSSQNATAGGDPRFQANATPSGQPAVRFDGNDEFRTNLSPGIGGNNGFVYIAVVRANAAQSGSPINSGGGAFIWDRVALAGAPLASLKPVGNKYGFQRRHDNNSDLGGPISSTSISTSDFQIVALRRNRSQNRFEIWVDGVMESTTADNGSPLTPDPINIGRHATNAGGGFNGDIAELLIYRDDLSSTDFDAVGSYLEARYGLDTAYSGAVVDTPISDTAGTTYFRNNFTFSGDPSRTNLWLESRVADGAVYHLNGTEIHRANLPAGPVTHGTNALSDVPDGGSTEFVPIPATSLVSGNNILTVSLHTAAGNSTATFAAALEGSESPPDPAADAALVLNEVAGAGDPVFFVEIANSGTTPVDTTGYVLAIEGITPATIPLPAATVPAGGVLQITEAQLGQRPADNDKLFLRTPGGTGVADAQQVTNRLRGRSDAFPGQWIFPDAPTPGSANSFTLESDIVINEICYHPPVLSSDPGIPATPRLESEEQWLELHNRGTTPVDLSDWDFAEGIDFTFPPGTSLPAGGHLVVAKDPVALLAAHPGIDVLGPYSGSLDRNGETIILRDAANNPADIVRYTDGGHWPAAADGGGSTLELRDPDADNSQPGAWAASDELARTTWQTYTYRGTATASKVGPDSQWREFIMGLHEEGEVLLDDITVTEDPDGTAVALITNGTFESGNFNPWRPRGNHRHAAVIPDPDGGGNVLHLRATGSTEHMHNNLETTLAGGNSVINGREYEISFRARWLSGCNLLHSRLYFNRLPATAELDRPAVLGTPGAANSSLTPNLGPTASDLAHSPPVPAAGEPVTVRADLTDPDGIDTATLHYSVNGGAFQQTPMAATGAGDEYVGTIPGQSSGLPVQFYVETTDTLGATSFLPAAGPDSRAMCEVDDGRAATTGIHNIRIIMTPADVTWMHTPINVMSNDRIPCTVIDRESEIYYNAGVRIKGSERARNQPNRVGFNLAFPKDRLFRGVHRTIAIDRSEGQVVGQRELLFDLMATSSRGIPGEFNDLCYVISPDPAHTSAAILQMARFGSVFLDSQFENGVDGTVYEYELIYYPTTADAQGYKIPQPDGVARPTIRSYGSNPEDYRWNFQIKNNQEFDDFTGVLDLVTLFDKSGAAFDAEVDQVLDTDQWLRALAYSCATGAGDSFFANSQHNGQFYERPDGRLLYFPHDLDFSFSATRSIFQNTELQKLTANPARKRRYLGHLHDICTSTFNQAWMAAWTSHYDALVPGGAVFNDDLSYINQRSNYILGRVDAEVSPIAFAIGTNGGADFSTSSSPVTLAGNGWVNIRELRLAGSDSPLPIEWLSTNTWSIAVPLAPGANPLTIEAYDFTGTLVASDSITVTSTANTSLPATDLLVVSEIYYNPPGSDESTEYVELLNISPSVTLDLTGTAFVTGISFTFPAGTTLTPGERLVLVANEAAFETMFGTSLPVGGTYTGNLDNSGESIVLTLANGTPVQVFTYNDNAPWPEAADGDGYSLVLINPDSAPDHNLATSWTAGATVGGTPGATGTSTYAAWKASFGNPADDADDDGDGWTVMDEYHLGGSPLLRDNLSPAYDFDLGTATVTASITKRADPTRDFPVLQSSTDLGAWAPATDAVLLSNERIPGSSPPVDRLTFSAPLTLTTEFFRFAY